jgi:hypothetical protein
MTSRVVNVSTFYATEDGVIYHPVSEEAKKVDHDVEQARERLSNILKSRQKSRAKNRGGRSKLTTVDTAATSNTNTNTATGTSASGDYVYPESGSEEEYEHYNNQETEAANTDTSNTAAAAAAAPLAIRQIERQLRNGNGHDAVQDREQDKMNKLLARSAAHATKGGGSKALPSQFVHQPKAADNAAKRAVVHHTGSHYVMAGSKQFQKGVRVKGVISRHSQQGAKLQAARSAKRNAGAAREDARGERAEGGGRSQGKSSSGGGKKKSKSKKGGDQGA